MRARNRSHESRWDELCDDELVHIYGAHRIGQAFGALVRRYQAPLLRMVTEIVGDRAVAETLCERAFVRSALAIDDIGAGTSFYSWVVATARATIAEHLACAEAQRDVSR